MEKLQIKYIRQLSDFYNNIEVDKYIIIPDHIHILLFVKNIANGASRTSPPTNVGDVIEESLKLSYKKQHSAVSRFVSTFKRFCNKEFGENVWQDSFFDHIIRNRIDYDEHKKYIYENPIRWYYKNK